MIVVRPNLESAERVMVEGDSFYIHKGRLRVHKGDELVAEFQHWAYALNKDNDLGSMTPDEPELLPGVALTPQIKPDKPAQTIRPLDLKTLTREAMSGSGAPGTSSSAPTHNHGGNGSLGGRTEAPVE